MRTLIALAVVGLLCGIATSAPALQDKKKKIVFVAGGPELRRWRAMTGSSVPTTYAAMRRWLRDNPDRPATRWARAEMLAITGDYAQARNVVDEMPIV